ncbi:EGF-like domain-containing protein [Trichonephila clavipes]|nr:EGF-like domain-containing protein [Trichonephila clavipes]
MMWKALNTISLSICRIMCESGYLLAHSISNVLLYCKPPTTYWFLNLGNKIKVTGRNVGRVRWVLQFFRTLTGRLERCSSLSLLKLSYPPRYYCKRRHLRSRLHPRWVIPFLSGYETTSDPRVMSIQKLVELSENSDGTLDNLIPREVHYVEPVVSVVTDYFRSFLKPPDFQPNCSIDSDCGEGALCVIPLDQDGSSKMDIVGHKGYCYCKPEYFGDGFTCTKIPWSYHRDKRIRRRVSRRHREPKTTAKVLSEIFSELSTDIQPVIEEELAHSPYFIDTSGAMLMEYEEEDSYLVSMCMKKRDCNQHASCYARKTGHPFCRCNPGYRGNGIFCWEMIDYIAAKDQGRDKPPD